MNEIIQVEQSDEFKKFKAVHKDSYLVHVFAMKKNNVLEKQVGYFDPHTQKITTFSTEPIKLIGSDEALSENGVINKLDIKEIEVTLEDALKKTRELLEKEYVGQTVTQEICILQHLNAQLWNITLVTAAFSMINIRIDAKTGTILSHEAKSLMSLGKHI